MQDLRVLYDVTQLGMAQISRQHRAGSARATEELARALSRTPGCELALIAGDFQGPAADFVRQQLPGLALQHRAWQTTLSRWLYRRAFPVKLMTDDTRDQWKSVRAARLAVRAALAPFRPFLRRLDARTLEQADVYHALGRVPGQITAWRARSTGRPLPVLVTLHDLIPFKRPEFFPPPFVRNLEKWLAGLSRDWWYLCSSENTRQDFLETGRCDPARVFVTPLAAGEEFRPCPEDGPAIRAKYALGDAPYLLSVCTLEPRKNLDTVIRTFLRLVRQESSRLPENLKLVLVGATGWKREKIQQAYATAGDVANRIVFTGHVPQGDLPGLYSQALAFVYLSFYEGFGLPVLEAMRCGLPVVTSNVSSLPEIVGAAGIMQDPRDEDALAGHLQTLCNDPAHRVELSRRALERAALFSWRRCAELTLDAYRTAASVGGR